MMESGWNALLIFGPIVAVLLIGIVLASVFAFWQYGWRGWKIPIIAVAAGRQ
jgi:predicted ABC-type sugar transport system permease subunit